MARLIALVLTLRYGRFARVPDRLAEFAVAVTVAALCWRRSIDTVQLLAAVVVAAVTLGVLSLPAVRRLVDPPVSVSRTRVLSAVAVADAVSPVVLLLVGANAVHGRLGVGVLGGTITVAVASGVAAVGRRLPEPAARPAVADPRGGVAGRIQTDIARRRTAPVRRLLDPFVGVPLLFAALSVAVASVLGAGSTPFWPLALAGAAAGVAQSLVCGPGDDRPAFQVGLAYRSGFLATTPLVVAVVATSAVALVAAGYPLLAVVSLGSLAYSAVIGRVLYVEPTLGGARRSRHIVAPPPTPGTEIGVRLAGVALVAAGVVAFG